MTWHVFPLPSRYHMSAVKLLPSVLLSAVKPDSVVGSAADWGALTVILRDQPRWADHVVVEVGSSTLSASR